MVCLQDDFDRLRPLCYPQTDVFLVCFSVVSPTSFHNVREKWLPEIRAHCPDAPLLLVGTQCDLRNDVKVLIELNKYSDKPVSEDAAKHLAHDVGAVTYIECSALTQKNLKEVFDAALLVVLERQSLLEDATSKKSKKQKKKHATSSFDDSSAPGARASKSGSKRLKKLCCFL